MGRIFRERQLIIRRISLIILDTVSIILAAVLALWLRMEFSFSAFNTVYFESIYSYLPINIVLTIILFFIFRLYHSMWAYAGVTELENIVISCALSAVQFFAGVMILDLSVPRSFYFIYFLLVVAFLSFSRFSYRIFRLRRQRKLSAKKDVTNTMVIGAGEAANMIIKEIISSRQLNTHIACIIDDSPYKSGQYIQGVRVVGTRKDIPAVVKKYNISEIIIAIPSASKKEISILVDLCKDTGCALKILPGIFELMTGEAMLSQLRNVDVEDLLGREPIKVDLDSIMNYVINRTVLVTGGGGSIGSELCRQLASHGAGHLIIVDIYENNAYDIEQELKADYPDLPLTVLIASVRNAKRIEEIMLKYKPDIVYHAAAHKHVPLMENSPNEAVKNNVFGTLNTVRAADKAGVGKFILISTDKAVNPTNIMGATKRMCEMIVQTYNNKSKTEFVAVRFGNVLGSNGSVIPLFKRQIAAGGPVTVTHPDIIRYFMTIPEAVSLVLQAGAFANGGEIFVLDMGQPVKIVDLAKNLIRLSGHVPDVDIAIEFTGLRPGEKLFEELLMDEEGLQDTENALIHIGKPIHFDEDSFLNQLRDLEDYVYTEPLDIKQHVMDIVSTYTPAK